MGCVVPAKCGRHREHKRTRMATAGLARSRSAHLWKLPLGSGALLHAGLPVYLERVGAKVTATEVAGQDWPLLLEVLGQHQRFALLSCTRASVKRQRQPLPRQPLQAGLQRTLKVYCLDRRQRLGPIHNAAAFGTRIAAASLVHDERLRFEPPAVPRVSVTHRQGTRGPRARLTCHSGTVPCISCTAPWPQRCTRRSLCARAMRCLAHVACTRCEPTPRCPTLTPGTPPATQSPTPRECWSLGRDWDPCVPRQAAETHAAV